MLTAVTTVGYGDVSYSTSYEMLYVCLLEVLATVLQAYLIMVLKSVFAVKKSDFEFLLQDRLKQTDEWILFKVESQMGDERLSAEFAEKIYQSFMLSFSKDHNMIVEEFDFYQRLPPKMQSELIEYCFTGTLNKFHEFFSQCEEGFRNELIIQMYHREIKPGNEIVWYKTHFDSIKFLLSGKIDVFSRDK